MFLRDFKSKMGNLCLPKEIETTNSDIDKPQVNDPQGEVSGMDDPDEYDKLAVEVLRSEFKNDPETFILNNVLMCYMFFEDFTEEIRELRYAKSHKAQRLNSTLIQEHKKQFFMPDTVLETVNRRVKFKYSSGPKKGTIEPLASQRLIIIHDNVEIIDEIEGYATIDRSYYTATVEESKDNAGFLKVNIFDNAARINSNHRSSSRDSAYSASSTIYTKRKNIPLFIPNEEFSDVARNDSGMSTAANSDPDYEYSRITNAQTPKSIDITEIDTRTNICQLPNNCIVKLKEKNTELDSDDEDEDRNNMINHLFVDKYYLNSSEFMKHFQNTIFPNDIGKLLGFSQKSIEIAKSIPGAMFCNRKDYNNSLWEIGEFLESMVEFEVVPAISMPRRHAVAFDWSNRYRKTVYEYTESKRISYKWPTDNMTKDAFGTLNSIIVPKGFMPKKKENSQMHLEWEVRFPKFERYLEFWMSHAQTRVFLFIIVLFKKFIEPLTEKHGLSVEHLRFLIFWQCELNYKDWLEDKLGNRMKTVLKRLYDYLGKCHLPHYFIRTKNMFENVPKKYLFANQEVIHQILEAPLSHFLTALKDLKYYSAKFYPQPNIDELENILKSDNLFDFGNTMNATALRNTREYKKRDKDSSTKLDKEQLWYKKFVEMKKMNAQSQPEIENQDKKNLASEGQELCLDVNMNFKKIFVKTEINRQARLLIFFIEHFIKMAQKSLKISSTDQTMFYLKQAFYLTKLLEEIEVEMENAKMYREQIKLEEDNCVKRRISETQGPSTPKRNPSQFVFHSNILQVKGMRINQSNLNTAYNSTIAKKVRPTKSNVKRKTRTKRVALENAENVQIIEDEYGVTAAESERNDDAMYLNNSSEVRFSNDVNSMNSDLESSDVENIEVIADVHQVTAMNYFENGPIEMDNEKNDEDVNLTYKMEYNNDMNYELKYRNEMDKQPNAKIPHAKIHWNHAHRTPSFLHNLSSKNHATNNLEKFQVENDDVDADLRSVPITENNWNHDDENSTNPNYSTTVKFENQNNDEDVSATHLQQPKFENGDDTLNFFSKLKSNFRIVPFDYRNKDIKIDDKTTL